MFSRLSRRTRPRSPSRSNFESLESRTLLSSAISKSFGERIVETSYAWLHLSPVMHVAKPHTHAPRATASATIPTATASALTVESIDDSTLTSLARTADAKSVAPPPVFLEPLSVESDADGTSGAIIRYNASAAGTYTATAQCDNGAVQSVVLDQPGELGEPGVGTIYVLTRPLATGQHSITVTITNATAGGSASTSTLVSQTRPTWSPGVARHATLYRSG